MDLCKACRMFPIHDENICKSCMRVLCDAVINPPEEDYRSLRLRKQLVLSHEGWDPMTAMKVTCASTFLKIYNIFKWDTSLEWWTNALFDAYRTDYETDGLYVLAVHNYKPCGDTTYLSPAFIQPGVCTGQTEVHHLAWIPILPCFAIIKNGELTHIWTAPDARRRGYARQLLQFLEWKFVRVNINAASGSVFWYKCGYDSQGFKNV